MLWPWRDLDGKVFPIGEARVSINYPPMHAHCRSTTIPQYEGNITQQAAGGEDDGKTYDVPTNMTYKEWAEPSRWAVWYNTKTMYLNFRCALQSACSGESMQFKF